MAEESRNRLIAGALGLALLVLAVASGFQKIRSPDYWWHLSIGNWMAANGTIPTTDVFTYTVPGAPYIDAHWLFQLGLAAVHNVGGHEGVVIAKALHAIALVAILVTVGWRRNRPFITVISLALVVLIAGERLLARPEAPSFVLLAAIVALLERNERRGDAWIYAIVPLQLLWANVHGLFAVGIALCGIYTMGEALRTVRGKGDATKLRRLATVTLFAALACLVNPNFIEGAIYPLEQLGMIAPTGSLGITIKYGVSELVPVWHPRIPMGMLVLPSLLALSCAASLVLNWKTNRSREAHALAFVAFLFLALQASRNLALFAIVAAPLLNRNANEWMDRHPLSKTVLRSANAAALALILAATFDVARGSFHSRIGTIHEPGLGYMEIYVTEGAVDWIERERPPAPIAHHMWYGGYLNWRLFPDYEVMVDGRLEIYGSALFQSLRITDPQAFQRLDAEYSFGTVLLSPVLDPPQLIAWLHQRKDWRLVYADATGVVFVRTGGDDAPSWPAIDVTAPDLLPELDGAMSVAHRKARIRLLLGLGRRQRAEAEARAVSELEAARS